MNRPNTDSIVGLDLGGTWMKGVCNKTENDGCDSPPKTARRVNPLHTAKDGIEFAAQVADFCRELTGGKEVAALVAATAGEVDADGKSYLCAGDHLGVMGSTPWVVTLAEMLRCPVKLINDAEAFLIGAAGRGLVPTNLDVGAIVIGTGVGFSVARKGRWWKPARRLVHFGSMQTPEGDYNHLLSAVNASKRGVFEGKDKAIREQYFEILARAIASAVHLFHLDLILLGGGATDAAASGGIDLAEAITKQLPGLLLPGYVCPEVLAVENGNRVILEGALALAAGEQVAKTARFNRNFATVTTETGSDGPGIETLPVEDVILKLIREEEEAAARFSSQVPALVQGATLVAETIRTGGRVIYLGAGTSGRLGALDAVEIPCTFGLPPDRFLAIIAGGVSDAALMIEDQFEEDTSSVNDLLLADIQPGDLLVGISASGTAFFVRSGLAFARSKGAKTIFLHENEVEVDLADLSIRLESGPECITGSTRMKAGTASKKALNILSTTAMILLGKVQGGEMIDLHCCNAKLQERAIQILMRLAHVDREQAIVLMAENHQSLRKTLDSIRSKNTQTPISS